MSTHEKEQLWQAYMDGELSATEMANFENSLPPNERELLTSDVQLERGIIDRLSEDDGCPEDVWENVKRSMLAQASDDMDSVEKFAVNRKPWRVGLLTLAAAAMIAFAISYIAPSNITPGMMSAPTVLAAQTVEELAEQSEVEADRLIIQDFMHENNIDLDLRNENSLPIAQVHSGIHLVGAATKENGAFVELYAGCCSRPVKIVLAKRDSDAAHALGYATGPNSDVQATRIVGDYLAAVVGDHPAHGLLDIFEGQHP